MLDLRWTHAPYHIFVECRGKLAVAKNFIAEYLCSHLLDGFLGEEAERLRDCDRGYSVAIETDIFHSDDLARRLIA